MATPKVHVIIELVENRNFIKNKKGASYSGIKCDGKGDAYGTGTKNTKAFKNGFNGI
jgi:hypothetical protein